MKNKQVSSFNYWAVCNSVGKIFMRVDCSIRAEVEDLILELKEKTKQDYIARKYVASPCNSILKVNNSSGKSL